MKGGEKAEGGMAHLWDAVDRKERLLSTSRLSKQERERRGRGLDEARENANCSELEQIFADGLNAYPQAMTHWEGDDPKPELVARMGVGKPHANGYL